MVRRARSGIGALPRWRPPVRGDGEEAASIERSSANDLMQLACDVGDAPMQIGAVLVLDAAPGFDVQAARQLIARRCAGVPRLRQRLVRLPLGCGRPIWIDDAGFAAEQHVRARACPEPGDERALLSTASRLLIEPLPLDRPPWAATFVTGLAGGAAALVIVFHHVLADGIGGLAILAALVDGAAGEPRASHGPRPLPTRRALAADAWRSRLRSLSALPGRAHSLPAVLRELAGLRELEVRRSQLNRPVGGERELALARAPLSALHELARRHHATVNDAVLTAIVAALASHLETRGERIDELVISVPVAGAAHDTGALGNDVGVMRVAIPARGTAAERLARTAAITREHKARAREASGAFLVPLLRAAGSLGVLRFWIDRQRLVNAFVTNVRGPKDRLAIAGSAVTELFALAGPSGNVTVSLAALSYAGALTITVATDPHSGPSAPEIASRVEQAVQDLLRAGG